MRRGRLGCAALVLSRSHQSVLSHIPIGLLDGLDDELARHNMHLTVSRLTDEQLSSEAFLPKVLREYMADGMIVNYTHEIPQPMLDVIRAHHTPAVWLNAKLASDCVYPDDLGAAQQATAELIARGHRRIALMQMVAPEVFRGMDFEEARPRFHYSVADRIEGYARAMRAAGLSPRITHHDRYVPNSEQLGACRTLLSGADRPTAVLLYSENDLPALLCAAAELRLSIPRDLSVLEFFPVEPSIAGMRVSVVPIPTEEMGRRAVAMLLRKIENPSEACAAEAVPYRAVTTDTVVTPAG
jgi:LacI family transcriptional regulator